jgi:hypothetical protein
MWYLLSSLHQWFTCVQLTYTYLTLCNAFSSFRSIPNSCPFSTGRWFATPACTAIAIDLLSSLDRHCFLKVQLSFKNPFTAHMKRKIEHSRPSGKGDTKLSKVRPCLSWPLECSFFMSVHFLLLWLLCLLLFALFPAWLFPVRAFRGRRLPLLLLLFCPLWLRFRARWALVVLRALIASCVRLFRRLWCFPLLRFRLAVVLSVLRLLCVLRRWCAGWLPVRGCWWCSRRRSVRRALRRRPRSVVLVPARGVRLLLRLGWAFRFFCSFPLRSARRFRLRLRWLPAFACWARWLAGRGGLSVSCVFCF